MNTVFRESWIDWSKTLLIWLMVLGHAGLSGVPREFVYAFHMPAFFIISGFLYKPHCWQKTLKSFGIPILFFSAINLCYVILKLEMKDDSIVVTDILEKIAPPFYKCNYGEYISLFTGVWFVIVLFGMRLLMGDISIFSFVRKYVHWLIPILVTYMSLEYFFDSYTKTFHDYYAYKVIGCLPLMMVGVVLKERKERLMNLSRVCLAILLAVYIAVTLLNGIVDIWKYQFGRHYLLFFFAALTASLALFNLCKKLKPNKIVEIFSRGTLLILGLHMLIIDICNRLFDILHLPCPCLIRSAVVMLTCYYPIRLALRYCPAILGK